MTRSSRQAGFTLVELLVVIAIVAILVALLLPAITSVREAASRVKCTSNMRQIALAVVAYENTFKVLPASGIVTIEDDRYEPRGGTMFSWMVLILPFVEEQAIYDQYDFMKTALEQPNNPQEASPSVYRCPSDTAEGRYFVDNEFTAGRRFAKGNYAAFVSPYHTEFQHWYPGALTTLPRHRMEQIIDGSSKTLLMSEVLTRDNPRDERGVWALPWNAASQLAYDFHPRTGLPKPTFEPGTISYGSTQRPNTQGPNSDMLYICPDPAEAQLAGMPCLEYDTELGTKYLSSAPRSHHRGGVNVAFLDGHAGFLPNNVDELAMACMVSSNDRQPIDPDEMAP